MKCQACGYKYNEVDETKEEFELISNGKESFIKLYKVVTHSGYNKVATLYGCPNCNTVRFEY